MTLLTCVVGVLPTYPNSKIDSNLHSERSKDNAHINKQEVCWMMSLLSFSVELNRDQRSRWTSELLQVTATKLNMASKILVALMVFLLLQTATASTPVTGCPKKCYTSLGFAIAVCKRPFYCFEGGFRKRCAIQRCKNGLWACDCPCRCPEKCVKWSSRKAAKKDCRKRRCKRFAFARRKKRCILKDCKIHGFYICTCKK